jgi:AmmeMemoRadiSam system protein B
VPETPCPKALIVPHAGYIYSGHVAAIAYKKLIQHQHHFSRVVLLGPSHRVAFRGIAVPECNSFRTPLGDIAIDVAQLRQIRQLPGVVASQEAHRHEHSLEVQLPFLQQVLTRFSLVPLVVGDASAATVAAVIDHFWQQPETLIVVSSDLSHYLDYEHARQADRDTVNLIEQMQPVLQGEQACGCVVLNGLLRHAAAVDAQVECVELQNSGDTAGDRARVVGYGAFIIY